MQTNANAAVAATILDNGCQCRQPAVAEVVSTLFPRGPEPMCGRCLQEEVEGDDYYEGIATEDPDFEIRPI